MTEAGGQKFDKKILYRRVPPESILTSRPAI